MKVCFHISHMNTTTSKKINNNKNDVQNCPTTKENSWKKLNYANITNNPKRNPNSLQKM